MSGRTSAPTPSDAARAPGPRRFARFRAGARSPAPDVAVVPADGLCLSAFLVLEESDRPGRVLLGRLRPAADWWAIGGLDPDRVARIGRRWMLPSSQLLLFESPADAARRIAREQLGTELPGLTGPLVWSEAYGRPGAAPTADPHWDLHFVFRGSWPADRPLRAPGFDELAFVEIARTPAEAIARAQGDVLALVGLAPGG